MPKCRIFRLHYCGGHYGFGFTMCNVTGSKLKVTANGGMTQNNGHYAVHGHSRSPFLVLIESLYATSS